MENRYPLSFEDFSKYLGLVEESERFKEKLSNLAYEYSSRVRVDVNFDYPSNTEIIIELIEKVFNDYDEWVSYWCYELDFGNKYKDGMIKDKDGNNIPLKTVNDLWNIIIDDYDFGKGE